jgi:transposase InsO family protein
VRFAFVKDNRSRYPVVVLCDVLSVSRSGFYAWAKRPAESGRSRRRAELAEHVRAAHADSRRTYGSPRVTKALKASGVKACENTVAKVMREQQIRSKVVRRFRVRTTNSAHAHPVADNLLDRNFAAAAPDAKWAADITYVPTGQGWLYLAAVIDLCSRRVVGWAMADHLRATLCTEALEMALARRKPPADRTLVHHSDRGVQYACGNYRALLEGHGIACSMSRKGDCYDNAAMESFFKTLKVELVYHERYATRAQAMASVFEYVECWYNRKRLHSSLGYMSPEQYERSLN